MILHHFSSFDTSLKAPISLRLILKKILHTICFLYWQSSDSWYCWPNKL